MSPNWCRRPCEQSFLRCTRAYVQAKSPPVSAHQKMAAAGRWQCRASRLQKQRTLSKTSQLNRYVGTYHCQARIQHFHQRLPAFARPFLSAQSATALTISAPPHVLARLRSSNALQHATAIATLSIYAPYHAPHLFGEEDITNILQASGLDGERSASTAAAPVLSSHTGANIWASTFRATVQETLRDIFLRPLDWKKTQTRLLTLVQDRETSGLDIIQIGTKQGLVLQQELRTSGSPVTIEVRDALQHLLSHSSLPQRRIKSKIAVVGMAGRFPGAQNHEDLWKLLEDQVDVCKEVPPLRWDVNTHTDATGKTKNTSKV